MSPDPHRLRRLEGCHPELVRRLTGLITDCLTDGHHLIVTQGVRTTAQQAALYAQGRTRPGKIVTNCDGVRAVSNHQIKADGYGYAADVAWKLADGTITWEGPWNLVGGLAYKWGLEWGGAWIGRFKDQPHLQWRDSPAPTAEKPS